MQGAVFSRANLPGVAALLLVGLFGLFADYQNRIVHQQTERAEVQAHLGLVRARLEGNINANIQLVRGLVAVIATDPWMTQQRFDELAANLFRDDLQLRSIAVAPGLVVSMTYPLQGNERAIGLDYMKNAEQKAAVLRARDTGEMVLAGPVNLVQGGQGFIGRFPVFLEPDQSQHPFWGVVSAVVDAQKLYGDSGLLDPALTVEFSLTGSDGLGGEGRQFFGSDNVADNDPVVADVVLPAGSWQIAAIPTGGWSGHADDLWLFRLIMTVVALAVALPLLAAGRLVAERQRNFANLKRREVDLERLSRRLKLALDAAKMGVWEYDPETDRTTWDERIHQLYGRPNDGSPKTLADWERAIHPDDHAQAKADYERAAEAGEDYASEFRALLPDGSIRNIRARATIFTTPDGARKMIGTEWDVTADVAMTRELARAKTLAEERSAELEAANQRIEYNALHDPLTGLPNRRYLDEVLAATKGVDSAEAALLHIDLDRFKQINDTLGHAAGDAMLIHAASVLEGNLEPGDFAARIGGDEFVIVCTAATGNDDLALRADRIIRQMRQPVPYHGHECRFGVSVGIAAESGRGFDPKRLMVNADIALYRAKSRGRNRYEFFTRALQAEIVATKRTADEILNGLERDEFVAYYQPQFDARTFKIAGVEALARWNHPARGVLAPDAFLKIAEELNVVAAIDRLILEQTLAHFAEWTKAGLPIPRVSVNVSARRLGEDDLVASLAELDIPRGAVSFELVESIFLDENDEVIDWTIDRIKDLGIDIEIDDFGTGYASILSLLKLKPKRLKIDRQLVMPIVEQPTQRQLVGSIIEIGKSLDVEVVAEGVETMEHAMILRDLGCDMLQGYAFAGAMRADAFKEFVRKHQWRKAS